MTMTNRNRFAWAINALSVVVLICFGMWSMQKREEQLQAMSRAEVIAEAILMSDTAVIGVDDDGAIVEWNEAATELTGYSQREAVGEPLLFLVPAEWRADHLEGLGKAVKQGRLTKPVQQVTCSIKAKCGSLIPVVFSLRMIEAGDVTFLATMNAADQVLQIQMPDRDST